MSQPVGGIVPIGHPKPLPTLVDVALDNYETVWAAAGDARVLEPVHA